MRISYAATVVSVLLFPMPVHAQEVGSPGTGLTFARANCAGCHAVESVDALSPNFDAPSFASVAATPGMTGHALAVWLQTSHPTMPNFIISPDDQDNIIAYILSLKPAPAR